MRSWLTLIIKKPNWRLRWCHLVHRFLLKFYVLYDVGKFLFSKKNFLAVFALTFLTSFFWLVYSSVSVSTGHNPFPVTSCSIFITVLASNICFSAFFTTVTMRLSWNFCDFNLFVHFKGFVIFFNYNDNRWSCWLWNFAQLNIKSHWHVSIASNGKINDHLVILVDI